VSAGGGEPCKTTTVLVNGICKLTARLGTPLFCKGKDGLLQQSSVGAVYHSGMACAHDNAQERIVEDAGERAECLGAELRIARGH
jgi:hypothetical protein